MHMSGIFELLKVLNTILPARSHRVSYPLKNWGVVLPYSTFSWNQLISLYTSNAVDPQSTFCIRYPLESVEAYYRQILERNVWRDSRYSWRFNRNHEHTSLCELIKDQLAQKSLLFLYITIPMVISIRNQTWQKGKLQFGLSGQYHRQQEKRKFVIFAGQRPHRSHPMILIKQPWSNIIVKST